MNDQEEADFAAAINRGISAADAYRLVFKVPKYTTKAQVKAAAAEMMTRTSVARLLATDDGEVTLQSHLGRLAQLSRAAQCAGQYGAAVAAEIARGKAAGLYSPATADDETTAERIEAAMRALADQLPG